MNEIRQIRTDRFIIPTLMYHHVDPCIISPISVTPDLFKRQIEFLCSKGWKAITIHEALEDLHNGALPPTNSFIITFDDAYTSFYEYALPILQELNFTACIYILSDFIGKVDSWNHRSDFFSYHMSMDQLSDLQNLGFELGCHSKTHQSLVKLDDLDLVDETQHSRIDLEDLLGNQVDLFCYPYGKFSKRVRDVVAVNFAHAYGVEEGIFDWKEDQWSIQRIYVGSKQTPEILLNLVSDDYFQNYSGKTPKDERKYVG